jgi:hypothetical protein
MPASPALSTSRTSDSTGHLADPTGATASPRVQGSVISLLWVTTTSVLVGGDLT